MGQVADTIKALEAKLAKTQDELAAETVLFTQSQKDLAAATANTLDDADKAAIAGAQAIINPPVVAQ